MNIRAAQLFSVVLAATMPTAGSVSAQTTRADEILDRFRNANEWNDNIIIVAHRGAAFREGVEVVAENSLASLERAVGLGVDMVEIDIRRTSDGVFVVSHDETLDRATNCTGVVAETSYEDIRECVLLVGADRAPADETVPTLEYFLEQARGLIMLNLDNKLGAESLADMYEIVDALGMTDYVVTTVAADTPEQVAAIAAVQAELGPRVHLMPNVNNTAIPGFEQVELIYKTLDFEVMQSRDAYPDPTAPLTEDGGILFSDRAQELANANDVHLWINTLSFAETETPDMRAGGRGDTRAITTGDLDGTYGFWVEHGATMLQTDEPELAIEYLEEKGYRKPYAPIKAAANP